MDWKSKEFDDKCARVALRIGLWFFAGPVLGEAASQIIENIDIDWDAVKDLNEWF